MSILKRRTTILLELQYANLVLTISKGHLGFFQFILDKKDNFQQKSNINF